MNEVGCKNQHQSLRELEQKKRKLLNFKLQEDFHNKQLALLRKNAIQEGISILPIGYDDLSQEPPRKRQKNAMLEEEITQNNMTTALSVPSHHLQMNQQNK